MVKEKENKIMDYIDLNSVGSTVTDEGLVFPIDCSEAPETASEAEEMLGVNVMDTCDEWWTSMSCEDAVSLFQFLAETDVYDTEGYISWAVSKTDLVEEANQMTLSGYTLCGSLELI